MVNVTHIAEGTVGGLARQLELAARALPQRKVDLHMIVSCERDPHFVEDIEAFRRLGVRVDIVPMLREPSALRDFSCYRQIKEVLSRRKPDVLHTHSSKGGILGRRAAHTLRIPCIHTPHVFPFEWATFPKRGIYRKIEQIAAGWCDRVVMLSELQKRVALESGIGPADKLTVIPNGVSTADYRPPNDEERTAARAHFGLNDERVIGVAARLEPQKGMGHFLRAAQMLLTRQPKTRFLVAGTGSLEAQCRARADKLGLRKAITFCGNISHMLRFYHAIDCFMLASLWEGLPYVILEAMACGLPIVSTRSFGCEGVIEHDQNGLLLPIQDEAGLARAAERVITDEAFASQLGQNARARVDEAFSLDTWADGLVACYNDVQR